MLAVYLKIVVFVCLCVWLEFFCEAPNRKTLEKAKQIILARFLFRKVATPWHATLLRKTLPGCFTRNFWNLSEQVLFRVPIAKIHL